MGSSRSGTGFRDAVYRAAREQAWHERDPHHAYPHYYRAELEEAFTALINAVQREHPDAELVRVGEDMGGPLWECRWPDDR